MNHVTWKDLPQLFVYDLAAVAIFVGFPALVLKLMRRRLEIWRVLFGAEVILLFMCLANCAVPGSWRDFWFTEAIHSGLAFLGTVFSVALERTSALEKSNRYVFLRPQIIAFAAIHLILAAIIIHAR